VPRKQNATAAVELNSPQPAEQRHPHQRAPYPLSIEDEWLLFSELAGHLASMVLFKVNTGLREQEVVKLRRSWEVAVPELSTSVFVIPRDYVKNGLDPYVILNRIARSVIERCRRQHPEFVFTRAGRPVTKIYNSGWKVARHRASRIARSPRPQVRSCHHALLRTGDQHPDRGFGEGV
jgi:integrase